VWGKSSKHKVEIQRKREGEPIQQMKPKVHVMFDGRGKTAERRSCWTEE
jgi:hypothetical protein